MTEQTTQQSGSGVEGNHSEGRERAAHRAMYRTLEEAQAITPPNDRYRVYVVTDPANEQRFCWAQSVDMALVAAARADGWKANVAEPKAGGPITKERIASRLSEFTDEELAAMGLRRAPQKGKK
jgi:hypothetical protein